MQWLQALQSPGALPATLVVVAHPDDEAVGAGSLLPRLRDAHFVYVTDGVPRDGRDAARHGLDLDGYRAAREAERQRALALCGIALDRVIELGCADQEAARRLPELAERLSGLIRLQAPAAVLTHPYEGGHPDHDATAFAVHAACELLRRARHPTPELIEMASYHRRGDGLVSGEFLPSAPADARMQPLLLDADARSFKRDLLACYATQRETLGLMRGDVERLRPAPAYDFLRPPHEGPVYYERFGWGTSAAGFCALAADAVRALGMEDPPWH